MEADDSPNLDHLIIRAIDDDVAIDVAVLTLRNVIAGASDIGYGSYIDSHIPAIASSDLVEEILQSIETKLFQFDRGDSDRIQNPLWAAEFEPIPAAIDCEASGMIPIREKTAATWNGIGIMSDPASMENDGRESIGSRKSSSKKSTHRRTGSMPKPEPTEGRRRNEATPEPAKPLSPEVEERERFREFHIRRLGKTKVSTSQTPMEDPEPVDPVVERYKALKETVKGRPYIYDHHGHPVIVTHIRPENLPKFKLTADVAVIDKESPTPVKPAGSPGASSKRHQRSYKEKKPNAIHYMAATNAQPSITQTMQLAHGVTLKEGATVKSGPQPPITSGVENMTLAQYRAFLEQEALNFPVPKPQRIDLAPVGDSPPIPDRTAAAVVKDLMPAALLGNLSPIARFNQKLVADPNWGLNPGPGLKQSPPINASRHISRVKLAKVKNPRTRPFIEAVLPKRHLAHPIYPGSKGHMGRVPYKEPSSKVISTDSICPPKANMPEKIYQTVKSELGFGRKPNSNDDKVVATPLSRKIFADMIQ